LILNILQNSPETHILLVANTAEDKHVMGAFRQGATGCLLANSPVEELYQSIRSLAEGGSYLPPMVGLKLIQKYNHTDRLKPQNPPILSTQQILVLRYISNGLTNQEIADILVISKRTVEMHVYKIFKKLKVSNRTQAIQAGLREGIIDVYDIPAVSESIPLDSKNWD